MRGVLVDVDGTLVLSNEAHAAAWSDAFAEAGIDVPPERLVGLIGMGGDRVLPIVVEGLDDEAGPGERIAERRKEIFRERYAPGLEAAPGARQLLERFMAEGLQLVVASSAKEEELRALLECAGVADLIEEATTSDDADSSKPAPDIVQAALEQAGLHARDVLMLGDTPYDVESAAKAGVGVVALRCGGWADEALAGAVAIYDDPADLLARFDGSPFSRAAREGKAREAS